GLDENFHMLDQWVEVEKTISKERNDWEVEKRGLQDVIKVYEQELKLLVEKIEEAKEFTSAADSKRSEMLEAQDELRKIEAKLESVVAAQEARLLRIIERIPAPLRDEIVPLTRRIPVD